MEILYVYILIMNVLTFALYALDKQRARRGRWRISESALLGIAALGGTLGAFLGIYGFRHKTKHKRFTIGVPLLFLIQIFILYGIQKSINW